MKYLILLALLLAAPAWAVDPQCVGLDSRNQQATADYSDGIIDLCIDERNSNGQAYPPTETITCDVSVDGAVIASAIGPPGSYHAIPVPAGVYASATVVGGPCTDSAGIMGVAGTPVIASFPAAPSIPGPRPPSLLP